MDLDVAGALLILLLIEAVVVVALVVADGEVDLAVAEVLGAGQVLGGDAAVVLLAVVVVVELARVVVLLLLEVDTQVGLRNGSVVAALVAIAMTMTVEVVDAQALLAAVLAAALLDLDIELVAEVARARDLLLLEGKLETLLVVLRLVLLADAVLLGALLVARLAAVAATVPAALHETRLVPRLERAVGTLGRLVDNLIAALEAVENSGGGNCGGGGEAKSVENLSLHFDGIGGRSESVWR